MKYIASGAQADIYRDGTNAIKLFKNTIQKEDIEKEINLQRMAFDYGLPVPEVFDIIEIDNKYGIVMEYVEGITVGKILMNDINKLEDYLTKSIEIQNSIHKIEAKKYPLMKDKLQSFIYNANKIDKNNKEKILKKLKNIKFKNQLCHGDFHIFNLIQTSNDIKIIDWVCASSGNPQADIYRTYLLYKTYKERFVSEMYIETYCQMLKLDKTKIMLWSPIIASARLGEYYKDEREEKILIKMIKNVRYNNLNLPILNKVVH